MGCISVGRTGLVLSVLAVTSACGTQVESAFGVSPKPGGVAGANGGADAGSLLGAGGSSTGSAGATQAGEPCSVVGVEQACCSSGTQTCLADGEFSIWGPCVAESGAVLTCQGVTTDCTATEAKRGCSDGGGGGHPDAGTVPPLCTDPSINTEPGILVGFSPSLGQTVGANGQIKVWVNDEAPCFISLGEQVNSSTGAVITPGDRTATAADGLLWEPALYLAPQSPFSGGTPYFPTWIRGTFNNDPPTIGKAIVGAQVDAIPPGAQPREKYTAEYVWEVSAMGLAPGQYTAVFVIHDGDTDRGIGCVTLTVEP